jgi:hypothetical protein
MWEIQPVGWLIIEFEKKDTAVNSARVLILKSKRKWRALFTACAISFKRNQISLS